MRRRARLDAEHPTKADANSAGSQRDLSISYEKSGDELAAKGALADALKAYRDGLAIAGGLTKAESENAEWRLSLSISHNKVGDVLLAQGAIDDALKAYRESLAIREVTSQGRSRKCRITARSLRLL